MNVIFIQGKRLGGTIEIQQYVYLYFIDYTYLFDKVRHKEMLKLLRNLIIIIFGKVIRIIQNLYKEKNTFVRTDN